MTTPLRLPEVRSTAVTVEPLAGGGNGRVRRTTATARFGSSRRESHDATDFYDRFVAPELSNDSTVVSPKKTDVIYKHDAPRHGQGGVELRGARRHLPSVLRRQGVRADARSKRRPWHVFRIPRSFAWRLRRMQAGARTRRADRSQRGQSRPTSVPVVGGRRHRDPPGSRACSCGARSSGGRAGRPVVHVPGGHSSDRAILCCGTSPNGSSSPARVDSTGPSSRTSALPSDCRRRERSPAMSSSRPPRTCGRSRRRVRHAWGTPPRIPSNCPSVSSSSTPMRAMSFWIRSWAQARPLSLRCVPTGTTSALTPTSPTSHGPGAGRRGEGAPQTVDGSLHPLPGSAVRRSEHHRGNGPACDRRP